MRVFIPNPGDDFVFWANNLQNEFLNYTVPLAEDSSLWREWVILFYLANPSFTNFPYPSLNIEDWKKWAELFVNNLYTVK